MTETVYWIWLSQRPRLGPVRLRQLLELAGNPAALHAAGEEDLARMGVSQALRAPLLEKELGPARAVLERCERLGITLLTPDKPDYPAALGLAADAPLALYCRGTLPPAGRQPWIGLVGARRADRRGLELARRFGAEIAACGGIVITGMAKGVDAGAAGGALDEGCPVVGVLGCGADVVYPKENQALFDRVARQGCLLSEYPPGTGPNARHFPARNRIISALSDGVVVIQAAEDSGALITARWAAEQGRDLFSVPGPPGDPLSRGCNQLLRNGAALAESGLDVMREYLYRYPGAVRIQNAKCIMQNEGTGNREPGTGEREPGTEKENCSGAHRCATGQRPPESPVGAHSVRPPLDGLSPDQRAIVEALADGPMQLDALIDKTGLPAARVLPQLTVLQIKKILNQLPGKQYELSGG